MKSPLSMKLVAVVFSLVAPFAFAGTGYWNNNAGGDFTNTANWTGGVPGGGDSAVFTNDASYQVDWTSSVINSNAFFNAAGGVVTQAIGSSSWTVTNLYVVATNRNSSVVQTSGTLAVTNAAGTARIILGLANAQARFNLSGGTIFGNFAVLGSNASASAIVAVDGNSTVWNNSSNLVVGSRGSGSALTVSGGATLVDTVGTIGLTGGATGNVVTVTGSGSLWTNRTSLVIGSAAAGNQLWISSSGKVVNTAGTIGSSAAALNNKVVVTGANSLWNNTGAIAVGDAGSSNQLVVSDGGQVFSVGTSVIGNGAGGTGNVLTVSGAGSLWSNNGALWMGVNTAPGNQLVISNGGRAITSGVSIGRSLGGYSNMVTVTGGNSVWNSTAGLTIGLNAASNRMVVSDGGLVAAGGNSIIGSAAGANNNSVLVSGGGSLWTNSGTVMIGSASAGNELVISDGGTVIAVGASTIGNSGAGNVATVVGNGSSWTNSSITIGGAGAFNQLMIADGARVIGSSSFIIGSNPGASNSLVTVSGSNSFWKSSGTSSYLGLSGGLNQLLISNGASVASLPTSSMIVGSTGSATSNNVVVTGTGSTWTVSSLNFGVAGGFNQLLISAGATVVGTNVVLGNSTGNVATVTGGGSMWTNNGNMTVGGSGFSNALFISAGGRVFAPSLTAGSTAGSNRVEITTGGLLEVGSLTAGNFGGNTISNDGGVYQFSSGVPTITPNGYGRISLTGGTIAFRGVSNANVWGSLGSNELRNILYSGNNTFRLDNASNTSVASPQNYTFASGLSPSNYVGLEMINGNTAWKSAWLSVGSGGSLLVSNSSATIDGVLTNSGTVRVVDGTVAWQSNVVLSGGSYTFAGATNTFASGLAVASGAIFGGSGRVVSDGGVTSAGTLSPGNSPGTLSFSSNLTLLGSSVLVLEIAGTNAADYDHLVVDGVFARAGTLTITNLGAIFAAGDTFDLFDFGSWDGAFSLTNLPTLTGGLEWDYAQFETEGILSIGIPIPEPSTGMAFALAGLVAAVVQGLRQRQRGTS